MKHDDEAVGGRLLPEAEPGGMETPPTVRPPLDEDGDA